MKTCSAQITSFFVYLGARQPLVTIHLYGKLQHGHSTKHLVFCVHAGLEHHESKG